MKNAQCTRLQGFIRTLQSTRPKPRATQPVCRLDFFRPDLLTFYSLSSKNRFFGQKYVLSQSLSLAQTNGETLLVTRTIQERGEERERERGLKEMD